MCVCVIVGQRVVFTCVRVGVCMCVCVIRRVWFPGRGAAH